MNWRLIFIRHAHRDTSIRSLDNGISEKGREQVKGLEKFVKSRLKRDESFAQEGALWFSSPKQRCIETLAPLAERLGDAEVEIDPRIDEMGGGESQEEFRQRIMDLIKDFGASEAQWVFVSSHGDWLPMATEYVSGTAVSMKKAAWVEYQMTGIRGELVWSLPDPRLFLV